MSTGASTVRAVSAQAVAAVQTSADLTWRGVQFGWRWSRSAAAPAMCGAAMLVPSNEANGPPAIAERRGEDLAARRAEVRLEHVAESGQAARGEAGDDPAAAGGELLRVAADPDPRPACVSLEVGAQHRAVSVGDHAAWDGELDRDAVRLAGTVVDDDDADRAGGLHALCLQRERADPA